MTSLAARLTWDDRGLARRAWIGFLNLLTDFTHAIGLRVVSWSDDQSALCLPLQDETACACSSDRGQGYKTTKADPFIIEGWIAFPTAIADGTATGTVFLESAPEFGLRSRVVANLAVERGGIQNWIHFRLPFGQELEVEGAYGVRATLVATDALTGEKRLFGTSRAASLCHNRSEAGIILELEAWG
jgi:hypothetical protein